MHDASMIGSGITITSGLMLWFGENATAIGAITAILMLFLTTIFQILNYRLNQQRLEFDRRKLEKNDIRPKKCIPVQGTDK